MKTVNLHNKVAIVTGASRGIGRAIALALAAEGIRVVASARAKTDLNELQQKIESTGGAIHCVDADLMETSTPYHIVSQTINTFGRLDILINNAGVVAQGPLLETPIDVWDHLMTVNVRAPFLLCKEAIPHLKAAGGGSIIQIVSVVGEKAYPLQGAYTASKHALMGMSEVLAQEVQTDNIRVHTILPGGVETDMIKQVRPDLTPDVLMQPDDIADIVLFLLTHRTNAVIDAVRVRRAVSSPWF